MIGKNSDERPTADDGFKRPETGPPKDTMADDDSTQAPEPPKPPPINFDIIGDGED